MAGRVVWVWVLIAVLSLIPSCRALPENYAVLATCFAGCTANYGSLFYFISVLFRLLKELALILMACFVQKGERIEIEYR